MVLALISRLRTNPVLRRAGRPLLSFSGVVVVGVAGFMALGGVGIVDAAFWLIDPTSIELHDAGRPVKAFSILVFVGMVSTGIWVGETVVTAVFGGDLSRQFELMQQEQEIQALEDHIVICGYGMFGRTVAAELTAAGRDVVLIEVDEQGYDRAVDDGMLAVRGDARREQTLAEARVDRCHAVICAVDDSNVSIQVAIVTTQIAPHAQVVVRVGEEMYEPLARRAGADTAVIPEVVSGRTVIADL
ncbi:MAG: NAD(P)-binding protein [Halobacteriales archaeon]|nr:NAD(P)-binding protein [Halobacteriales archaeon]